MPVNTLFPSNQTNFPPKHYQGKQQASKEVSQHDLISIDQYLDQKKVNIFDVLQDIEDQPALITHNEISEQDLKNIDDYLDNSNAINTAMVINNSPQQNTNESLMQELKELLAPDQCLSRRCPSCRDCTICAPSDYQSSKNKTQNRKREQNSILRDAIQITTDRDTNVKRIVVSLPIDKELATKLRGSNRRSTLCEWDSKITKLDSEMRNQITEEFEKLVDKGFFL